MVCGLPFCLRHTARRRPWSAHRRNGGLGAGCEAAVEMGTQRGSARLGCGRGQRTLWRMAAKDRVAMPLDEFQTPLMSFRHLFLHLSLEQG